MTKTTRVLTEGNGHQKANRDIAVRFLLSHFDDALFIDDSTIECKDWGQCHVAAYTSPKGAMVSSATAQDTEFGSREWHNKDNCLMFRDVGDGRCFVYVCDIKTLLDQRKPRTHFVQWEEVRRIAKKSYVFESEKVNSLIDKSIKPEKISPTIASRVRWTREETLLALELYCSLNFGQLSKSNKSIVMLAEQIGRTPSSIAMKACNFASLDDSIEQKGLTGASELDKEIWQEFKTNPTQLLLESELNKNSKQIDDSDWLETLELPQGETTTESVVKVRKVQRFFRRAVLQSYGHKCAISNVNIPELLIASHIIPWSKSEEKRADPSNGIALNSLYDKAFDRGYISLDENYKVLVCELLKLKEDEPFIKRNFIELEGSPIDLPEKFKPNQDSLEWHRNNLYMN